MFQHMKKKKSVDIERVILIVYSHSYTLQNKKEKNSKVMRKRSEQNGDCDF